MLIAVLNSCAEFTKRKPFTSVSPNYGMVEEHTADLRNVNENDTVVLETTEGEHFEAKCTNRLKQNADPRSGEIRETHIWEFDAIEYQPVISITDGLKSSPDDPDFPLHKEVYDRQQEGTMGYVESVEIVGVVNQ